MGLRRLVLPGPPQHDLEFAQDHRCGTPDHAVLVPVERHLRAPSRQIPQLDVLAFGIQQRGEGQMQKAGHFRLLQSETRPLIHVSHVRLDQVVADGDLKRGQRSQTAYLLRVHTDLLGGLAYRGRPQRGICRFAPAPWQRKLPPVLAQRRTAAHQWQPQCALMRIDQDQHSTLVQLTGSGAFRKRRPGLNRHKPLSRRTWQRQRQGGSDALNKRLQRRRLLFSRRGGSLAAALILW